MIKKQRHPFVTRRKELGYTQQQVADVVGLTSRAIQLWEAGTHQPSLTFQQVADLCDFLKCSVRELADDFKKPESTSQN